MHFRVRKNSALIGGWRAYNVETDEVKHFNTFSSAVNWVDYQNRKATVVIDPEYRNPPTPIWLQDGLVMFITADRDNAIIATQGRGEFVKIPVGMLPAVARSLLTLRSQHLAEQERMED